MIADAIDAPLLANLVEGGSTPILDTRTLKEIGYGLSIHPCTGFLAAAASMRRAYEDIGSMGRITGETELFDFGEFSSLMGFEEVWAFTDKYQL